MSFPRIRHDIRRQTIYHNNTHQRKIAYRSYFLPFISFSKLFSFLFSNLSNTCIDLLPLSSLPPRKRQKMKYFLESNSSCDIFIYTPIPRTPSPPLAILSSDAYLILIKFISSSQTSTPHFEQLLDQSPACGIKQRLMLATLCHQWVGDIRIIHGNLRPEISSFLPHILLMNILSKRS